MCQIDFRLLDQYREGVEAVDLFLTLYRSNELRRHVSDEVKALQVLSQVTFPQAVILVRALRPDEQEDLYHKICVAVSFGEQFPRDVMSKVPGVKAQDRVISRAAQFVTYGKKLLPALRNVK
jgi:hypothetical protein